MSKRRTPPKALFWLQFAVFKAFLGGMKRLPYSRRLAVMGALSRRVIGPVTGYRKRALDNLAMIYPDMPLAERRRIADAVLDNFGRTLIENNSQDEFRARIATHQIEGAGFEAAQRAKDEGRTILYCSGHWSNHEAARTALDLLGFTIAGVHKPVTNPYFHKHYVDTIASVSGPVFSVGRQGTRDFVRYLRNGGQVGIFHDVHFGRGPAIDFLGKPAHTALTVAELAIRFDAVVIPFFATRKEDGESFKIELLEPIPHGEPLEMMTALTRLLEERIAKDPTQWFWLHRRWKTPRHLRGA